MTTSQADFGQPPEEQTLWRTSGHALVVHSDACRALAEDLGSGDRSAGLLARPMRAAAHVLARENCVLAGCDWFDACFRLLDPGASIHWQWPEGSRILAGQSLCRVEADASALLSAERSALNFLQTLSGTATTTAGFVALLAGSRTRLLDTRKTLPGLRYAQKYAVRVGGGCNHRMGLWDAILIKENHIAAIGSISAAIAEARRLAPDILVEIEVETLSEYAEAIAARPDRIMLDEFDDASLRSAVAMRPPGIELEVSGSVDATRLRQLAALDIDYVSVGALTKHVRAVDLSMRWVDEEPLEGTRARGHEGT